MFSHGSRLPAAMPAFFLYLPGIGEIYTAFQAGHRFGGGDKFANQFLHLKLMCMFRLLSALLLITITFGCKKESPPPQPPKPIDLLTSGQWLLTAYGWDDDSTGDIEDHENMILDCQKDNSTQFYRDGIGKSLENQNDCNNTPDSEFKWKFIDNNQALEIGFQRLDIHVLTKDELHFKVHIQGLIGVLHTKYRKL